MNSEESAYLELKTELQLCQIGGLFLVLYQDKDLPLKVMRRLQRDLPQQFHIPIWMEERKVPFSSFFGFSYEQLGDKSNVFYVLGIEKLSPDSISDFIRYLQYGREHFKVGPYSLVFWIKPDFEKQLFLAAPDFHHWVFSTYDFTSMVPVDFDDEEFSFENIKEYFEKVIWQYENWQQVKKEKQDFLIEVMGRANLYSYYVQSYCLDKNEQEKKLDDLLDEFLVDSHKHFLTLLGDFGTGKSSFALHYYIDQAKKYLHDPERRIPIFISLKDYPSQFHIEKFLFEEFHNKFNIEFPIGFFQELALQGRFIFFIDGFDEMASTSNEEQTRNNLKELTKLSFENVLFMSNKFGAATQANKVFLTCRTHYFLTELQEKEILKTDYTVLYRNYATKSSYELARIRLKEFKRSQIEEYIYKVTQDKNKTKKFLDIIDSTYNLQELSTRPILLEMIVKSLPEIKDKRSVNVTDLYRAYTGIWIEREDWRAQMTPAGKRAFMWQLAIKMFEKSGDFSLHYSLLKKPERRHLKENYRKKTDDYYKYEVTTCSFLNRDEKDGNYKFIHKSFMEYFLAECFFNAIKRKNKRVMPYDTLNREIKFFLKKIISSSKKELFGLDLSDMELKKIDLAGAELQETILAYADLEEANLEGARLVRANLQHANLTGANLRKADLKKADLRETFLFRVFICGANVTKDQLDNQSREVGWSPRIKSIQNAQV